MTPDNPSLAKYVAERLRRAMPVIQSGEFLQDRTSDDLAEALARRWLVADMDTGHLQVNTNQTIVEEIERQADLPDEMDAPAARTTCEAVHTLVCRHAARSGQLHEISAPGTGKPGPVLSNTPPLSTPAVQGVTPTTPMTPPDADRDKPDKLTIKGPDGKDVPVNIEASA